nr:hypothetical protein [Tanacetum cinerariifolium]
MELKVISRIIARNWETEIKETEIRGIKIRLGIECCGKSIWSGYCRRKPRRQCRGG